MAKAKKNEPIKVVGKILKVVRDTKDVAQVTFQIPTRDSTIIPIGDVNMTITVVQQELKFGSPVEDGEDDE